MNDSPEQPDLELMLARRPLTPPSAKLDERMAELFAEAALPDDAANGPRRFAVTWVRVLRAVAACVAIAVIAWVALLIAKPTPGTKPTETEVVVKDSTKDTTKDTTKDSTRGSTKDAGKDNIKDANPAVAIAPPAARDFKPVRIEQSWTDTRPDGLVMVDGDPLRRYHRQTVQRVQLIDDKNNVRIEYTVPRNEVVVTPVRYD